LAHVDLQDVLVCDRFLRSFLDLEEDSTTSKPMFGPKLVFRVVMFVPAIGGQHLHSHGQYALWLGLSRRQNFCNCGASCYRQTFQRHSKRYKRFFPCSAMLTMSGWVAKWLFQVVAGCSRRWMLLRSDVLGKTTPSHNIKDKASLSRINFCYLVASLL
jgi:hypothetical protein